LSVSPLGVWMRQTPNASGCRGRVASSDAAPVRVFRLRERRESRRRRVSLGEAPRVANERADWDVFETHPRTPVFVGRPSGRPGLYGGRFGWAEERSWGPRSGTSRTALRTSPGMCSVLKQLLQNATVNLIQSKQRRRRGPTFCDQRRGIFPEKFSVLRRPAKKFRENRLFNKSRWVQSANGFV
jgi:hypothetical protein